jgi:hypothetical protein
MWRSAIIILLLAGSPAFAGQASAVIHVGITITGSAAQTPARARASSSREQAVASSLGGARAAVLKRSALTRLRPRRPQ